MFYITFHKTIRNVCVYDDSGNQLSTGLLATPACAPALSELRGLTFGPNGYLYVCNGYKDANQVLVYQGTGGSDAAFDFIGIYADPSVSQGIAHPFAIDFDAANNGYVSSQDTNVVTVVSAPAAGKPCDATPTPPPYPLASALGVASYLQGLKLGTFLPGTFVASSYGDLNQVSPVPPDVTVPQGLALDPPKGPAAHSVRDVLIDGASVYVADEPGNAVKVYALETGQLQTQITGDKLKGPVHLLLYQGSLYISSATSIFVYNLSTTALSEFLSKLKSPAGMAFDSSGNFYFADRKDQIIYKSTYDVKTKKYGQPAVFIPKHHPKTAPHGLRDDPEFLLYVPK